MPDRGDPPAAGAAAGRTLLVLLPGMDGTGLLFTPLRALLEQHFDVRVLSYPPDRPLGYAALESLLRQTLASQRDFVLLGESFSGPLAIALAASGLPGLKGLVLCCTFARNPQPRLAALRPLTALLPVSRVSIRLVNGWLLGRFATAALRAALANAIGRVKPAVMRARMREVLVVDVRDRLARVRLPVLYLQARQDRLVPPGAADEIRGLCPQLQTEVLDGPHFLLQARPTEAVRQIVRFAGGLTSERAT